MFVGTYLVIIVQLVCQFVPVVCIIVDSVEAILIGVYDVPIICSNVVAQREFNCSSWDIKRIFVSNVTSE